MLAVRLSQTHNRPNGASGAVRPRREEVVPKRRQRLNALGPSVAQDEPQTYGDDRHDAESWQLANQVDGHGARLPPVPCD
jgi:hypothetical protein